MSDAPPRVLNAPGLVWRRKGDGWLARWQARSDLVKRGYRPSIINLWEGTGEPNEPSQIYLQQTCNSQQAAMTMWGRGGVSIIGVYDGTLRGLIQAYRSDPDSRYAKLRYRTRLNYDSCLRRVDDDRGEVKLVDIDSRALLRWHEEWSKRGTARAHSLIATLRSLMTFGRTILEREDRQLGGHCIRIKDLLHDMRFSGAGVREVAITAEQATAIRHEAHNRSMPSIALAQAIQFDLLLRQRDVLGEWVPLAEPGTSDIVHGQKKWLRGLRWSEIDSNWTLLHVTSKRQKPLEIDLKLAPMVWEELERLERQTSGPLVISEETGVPWDDHKFRRTWRKIARDIGIPDDVCNCDSRAGGISEATDSGAKLEHVRHAATHSNIATTLRYSRNSKRKIAEVQRLRAEYRTKQEGSGGK